MKVLIPVADGCEEMEAVIAADVFRRVPWTVTLAGLRPGAVRCARGVRLVPDACWSDLDPAAFDLLVIPGGQDGVAAGAERAAALARGLVCAPPGRAPG